MKIKSKINLKFEIYKDGSSLNILDIYTEKIVSLSSNINQKYYAYKLFLHKIN